MRKINIISLFCGLILLATSCTKKPDIENTSTVKMAGEWFVNLYTGGNPLFPKPQKIMTYNTADPSSGKVWVDDLNHIWPFKAKFDVDYSTLSFKPAASILNEADGVNTIKLISGKILPNGGHSKSGVTVDSIYMKLEFSDDVGTEYEIKGNFRTGFFEDEY